MGLAQCLTYDTMELRGTISVVQQVLELKKTDRRYLDLSPTMVMIFKLYRGVYNYDPYFKLPKNI